MAAGLLIAGCGGGEAKAPAENAPADSANAPAAQTSPPESSGENRYDFCSLLPPDEISAAFGGKLSFSVIGPDTKSCQHGIDDENAVSLSILLLVFDGELPVTNEEIAAALTQLGSKLVERL